MRLVSYRQRTNPRLGALIDDRIVDVQAAYHLWQTRHPSAAHKKNLPGELLRLLQNGSAQFELVREIVEFAAGISPSQLPGSLLDQTQLLPPVVRPGKVIAVGLNYPPFPAGDNPGPPYPVLFHKTASALTGHNMPIRIPPSTDQVEYEGELAVVIGQTGRNIRREAAYQYVAGYTIANDVGARDWQQRSSQWTSGKMADTFCPLGPALVTTDELPDPSVLRIRTTVNGEALQDGHTAEMIFDVPQLVSYISEVCTLEAGDVILTGSPKRAGNSPDPRRFLQAGDEVQISISGLGLLCNPVIKEKLA